MAATNSSLLLGHIRKLAAVRDIRQLRDPELLERFISQGDEEAFACLVQRYQSLVLRVCQGVLRHSQDAEDVFQATFLVLARKARSIRKQASVGSWLYGVAYRLSCKARAQAARRSTGVEQEPPAHTPCPLDELTARELQEIVLEEFHRLPQRYRAPLLLCYWEGKTYDEIAVELQWKKGTVKDTLERARRLLRGRLSRRDVALPALFPLALLARQSTVVASTTLLHATVRAALSSVGGTTASTAILSRRALALAEAALRMMSLHRLKNGMIFSLVLSAFLGGSSWSLWHRLGQPPPVGQPAWSAQTGPGLGGPDALNDPVPGPAVLRRPADDGDPLPTGAVARIGTPRFRHGHVVSSIAYSPDGKILASGSWDKTVRLWDAATGKQLQVLSGHEHSVTAIAFAPDGKTLAAGYASDVVRLWNVAQGTQFRDLAGSGGGTRAVAFSPDGKQLASCGWDNSVRLWQTTTGKEIGRLPSPGGEVLSLVFAPDGKTIVFGAADGTVRWWETATGRELHCLPHKSAVSAVAISPDGTLVASGGDDQLIRLWDFATGEELRQLPGHRFPIRSLSFAADGKTLASAAAYIQLSGESELKLWDAQRGKLLRSYGGHHGEVHAVALAPDGKTLASAGSDNTLRIWDNATGKELGPQAGHRAQVATVAFAPDGGMVASASDDRTIRLWHAVTHQELRRFRGHEGMVQSLAFSADGKTLASAGREGTIRLWQVATGRQLRCWKQPAWFHSVAFSPNGKLIAAGSSHPNDLWQRPGAVWVWDRETGAELWHQEGHRAGVRCIGFSPDGEWLASGSNDRTIALWRVATGTRIRVLMEPQGEVESLAFSPDGRFLAAGSGDHRVRLWNTTGSERMRELDIPADFYAWVACSVSFSADSKTLAVGSWQSLHLYAVATGEECRVFAGHQGDIRSVAFAPDGRTLVSGSGDATILFWDLTGAAGKKPGGLAQSSAPKIPAAS